MSEWICSCGQKNTSKFCTRCGKTRSVVDLSKSDDNVWTCSCGNKNAGAFCSQCGQKRIPSSSNDIDKKINPPIDSTPTTQPLKQNPPQLSEYPTQTDNNKRNYVIIGLLVVIIGLVCAITYLMLKEKPEEVVANLPAESTNEKQVEQTPILPALNSEIKTNISDVSLGNICIGFSKERVYELIGLENQITDPDFGYLHYQYPDIEVTIIHDVVTGFSSKTAQVSTPRGIHQGSSLQEVINAYGKDFSSYYLRGDTIYEYTFTSVDGKKSSLCFAVQNDIVNYIRGQGNSDITARDSYDGAYETFREYYRFITNKKYHNAYDILTDKQKKRRGTFDEFVKSCANNIGHEVEDIRVKTKNNFTNVSIEYTLIVRDKQNNGKVKVQRFKGEATLIYSNARWFIDYARSSKVSEHME